MAAQYDIGEDLLLDFEAFEARRRATGRSTTMFDDLRNGDVVVCVNIEQGRIVHSAARERGVQVEVLASTPPELPVGLHGSDRRVHFDHVWVTAFYRHYVALAGADFETLVQCQEERAQRPLSAYPK